MCICGHEKEFEIFKKHLDLKWDIRRMWSVNKCRCSTNYCCKGLLKVLVRNLDNGLKTWGLG